MKKIALTVGLAALSLGVKAQYYIPGFSPVESSNAWSLSLASRGFYDDNYLTKPPSVPVGFGNTAHPPASWGADITPSAAANHTGENTFMSAGYLFDYRRYENHNREDMTHEFNGRIEHDFGKSDQLSINESFVVAQEPTVMDPTVISTPYRILGSNIRNTGQIDFTHAFGDKFSLRAGYDNTVYAYAQTARSVVGYPFIRLPLFPIPSRSALSDRMEQAVSLDLRWNANPTTTAIVGYQYGRVTYTSPEYIIFPSPPFLGVPGQAGYTSNIREAEQHIAYAGVRERFTPALSASLRVGAEYIDYDNFHTDQFSPYADASIAWGYSPGDSAQLGVKHLHNVTDVVDLADPKPILDEESTAAYVSETHKFTDRLTFAAMGRAQFSTLNGRSSTGTGIPRKYLADGQSEDFFVAQLNLAYQLTPWLVAEGGYNYSRLTTSDAFLSRYARHFGYLGLRATWGPKS